MAKFKPGNSGKPKGAKNKSLTRGKISAILNDESTWTKFAVELKKLKGRAYCDTLIKLFEFSTPKYSAITLSPMNMSEDDLQFLFQKFQEQLSNDQKETLD